MMARTQDQLGRGSEQSDTPHLHARSAEVYLRGIRAQISAGFTLCSSLEIEMGGGRIDDAEKLAGKVRRTVASLRRHLDEPIHVSPHSDADVRDGMAQLEYRLGALEAQLHR